jgi:hypothetical protein
MSGPVVNFGKVRALSAFEGSGRLRAFKTPVEPVLKFTISGLYCIKKIVVKRTTAMELLAWELY